MDASVKNKASSDVLSSDHHKDDILKSQGGLVKNTVDSWYAKYVLFVLFIVYVFNFVDRQILSILAEDIKRDMDISDSQLGFLFGTAFAVFYATFGIVLARLADVWNRKTLISVGVAFWSCMTALGGLAKSFVPLAICRFGVGVGEASATPAAFSILYDYFSPKIRTTVLAIYSSGISIGAGLGLFLGGTVVETWNTTWPDSALAPFGLSGWRAAIMIVGLPGLLVSMWVFSLKEPVRGQSEGISTPQLSKPFRETLQVLGSMVPVVNWQIISKPGCRLKGILFNVVTIVFLVLISFGLIKITGDILQWVSLGIGVYAVMSWTQWLSVRDPVVFGLIFRCPTLLLLIFACGASAFVSVGIGFWIAPYLQRVHGIGIAEVGAVLGIATASMGFVGMIVGGVIADTLRRYTRKGKLYIWIFGVGVSKAAVFGYLIFDEIALIYVAIFISIFVGYMAHGPLMSTVVDLMLPRGRATVSAFLIMVGTFVGFALGPYFIGYMSDYLSGLGASEGESLRLAMMYSLILPVAGIILVLIALKYIERDENTLFERARSLGENI